MCCFAVVQNPFTGVPIAMGLSAALYFHRRKKERGAGLLSTQVAEARGTLCKKDPPRELLRRVLASLYYPSAWSIIAPLIGACLVVALDLYLAPRWIIDDEKLLSNLIAVETGLTAIIFPLVIFIIELTGDRSETGVKKSEVVLRESFLFPSVIFVLLCLLAFTLVIKIASGIALILATTVVSIAVLFRVIRILLDDHKVISVGREVLKDKVRRGLHLAINERLANNLLVKNLKALGVEPHLLSFDEDRDAVRLFRVTKMGTVRDVDFRRLKEFIAEIPSPAPGSRILDAVRTDDAKNSPKIFFTTRIGDKTTEERNVVIAVERIPELTERHTRALSAFANEIIDVVAVENYQEILGTELSRLKDFMLVSIDDARTGAIDIASDHYVAITETFLEELARCNSTYSSERAREEMSSIFGKWDAVENVARHVYEFYERALMTNNKDVVKLIAYLPIAISARALRFKDHYLFQRFTIFARYLYDASLKHPNENVREFLADRAFRHIRELADFHIEPHLLKRKLEPDSLTNYGDFAIELLSVYQGLMKLAIDAKDRAGLEKFLVEFQGLFDRFQPERESRSARHYDLVLANQELSQAQRLELEAEKNRQRGREGVRSRIILRRRQILFGLSSWAYRLWEKDRTATTYRDAFVILLRTM